MNMIIQYRYNMKMTHVIKLVHTHTKKKKTIKYYYWKGRKYVIIVFIPINITQYFADTHKKT